MHMYRPIAILLVLLLASALSACGNKGNLVKPTPAKLPPPEQKTDDASQTPSATDATPKPAQDSGGH